MNRASKKQKLSRRTVPKQKQPVGPGPLAGVKMKQRSQRAPAARPIDPPPQATPISYSSLARESLVNRLTQIEALRPKRYPYDGPDTQVTDGPSGTVAYANRIAAHIRQHSVIPQKELDYLRLLAGILHRDASEAGAALDDALNYCRVKPIRRPALVAEAPAATVPKAKRLPWTVLPPGEWAFSDIQSHFHQLSRERRDLQWDLKRLDYANRLKPSESWIGKDEFDGYVIFIFRWTKAALLDHPIMGNACYVLRSRWRELSHLSKSELLRRHPRRVTRIVHKGDWRARVKQALERDKP
jgi:hypothetical protein